MDRSTTEFDSFLAEIAVGLEALTFEERQKVLRLLVEKITYEDGKTRVEIVIPPAPVESEGATAKLHNRLPEPVEGWRRKWRSLPGGAPPVDDGGKLCEVVYRVIGSHRRVAVVIALDPDCGHSNTVCTHHIGVELIANMDRVGRAAV